ncbi:MAG: hormogonium polysaccharide biosynthesis protein HpsA [Limnospira sp. PMC 894.15]|uniref:Hormogonium polysaccharide biosynthesis protein HpsA n=1 Tax=Limnospira fusiformis PMC 851.14 TaxID=2219512 RepID=A0ABU9EK71_LIMFS|nr:MULTISPECIES: hormogonium polysaccharide biosynthesis protein HpsA [unclassified Limnospira]MDT9186457.1 hormogonium polysaccharide biosynthesis protein HpsA [Limnospira sp. PMC 894.15]MDT9232437.1 hormogonium polysaccharide biosynthesis protein HpsA [Limnospira sp. PMC 917.15]MDT9274323.1 hormogonium polysaccharide biosynthesis protein HpsA [Limnospira sp. PMC 737.11]
MHNQHNHRKPKLPIRLWLGEIRKFGNRAIGGLKRSLLGNWLNMNRGDRQRVEGFVLPTVTMVMLVVVLLTVAIAFRALDRAQVAQNVRVSQEVLLAATPALERANAKLTEALNQSGSGTPEEGQIVTILGGDSYTFRGEERLTLEFDINEDGTIQDQERINTAWGFEDFNGDGEADRYNIYGIFFRSPSTQNLVFNRPRTPIEARGNPVRNINSPFTTNPNCPAALGSSASLVSGGGWFRQETSLIKPFFIYAASIPISGRGFAAVEMQEDRRAVPVVNNAVVYENDVDITPGQALALNGRIMANGNMFIRDRNVTFRQVSSPASCYYEMENSKIIIGGNIGTGRADENSSQTANTPVDLFRPNATPVTERLTKNHLPADYAPNDLSYDDLEYAERIKGLVDAQMENSAATDPEEVQEAVEEGEERRRSLEIYFTARTRRVPNLEAKSENFDPSSDTATLNGSGNTLRAKDEWIYPQQLDGGDATRTTTSGSNHSRLNLSRNGNRLPLPARNPDLVREEQRETELGDRILVGNGLPARWYNNGDFSTQAPQFIQNIVWNQGEGERFRRTRMFDMPDLGNTGRNGFWERAAAREPTDEEPLIGGARIVTGAGIYLPSESFLPRPARAADNPDTPENESAFDVVWPDTMAMWEDSNFDGKAKMADDKISDLKMRATVVYHYTTTPWEEPGDRQNPIACISSYYDPTTQETAKNRHGLPWEAATATGEGMSHNGIVYALRILSVPQQSKNADGRFTNFDLENPPVDLLEKIYYQADLVFPDGRFVNEPLRKALATAPANRSLEEQSAIDAAVCAMTILNGVAGSPTETTIPHGTIFEGTLLDARQVKALEDDDGLDDGKGTYDRPLEDRQPLEIRTTVIDLDKLRQKAISGRDEFLLPNSGIIYATRDDALRDDSTGDSITSPVDFVLDETRRPNGIMLINGQRLDRRTDYFRDERGLILVSNLPAYVKGTFLPAYKKGTFNLHQTPGGTPLDEFMDETSDFYARSNPNPDFACRAKDPRLPKCTQGDTWRPATVLSDAVTLLSSDFREGYRWEGDYNLRNNMVLSQDYRQLKGLNPVKLQGGYDVDGSGDISSEPRFNERHFRFDLNGNGTSQREVVIGQDEDGEDITEMQDEIVSEADLTLEAVRRINGFYDNNFITTQNVWNNAANSIRLWIDREILRSSYVNNYVTPIQTRAAGIEYLMEICRKPLVSMCEPKDWVVNIHGQTHFPEYASELSKWPTLSRSINNDATGNYPPAGTTAERVKLPRDRIYPRRIAFLRDYQSDHKLFLDSNGNPVPLAVNGNAVRPAPFGENINIPLDNGNFSPAGTDTPYSFSAIVAKTNNEPRPLVFQMDGSYPNIRWKPSSSHPDEYFYAQPLWEPVVQLNTIQHGQQNLLQPAVETTFNLIIASGDSPIRPTVGNNTELNGGFHNFTRFLERWNDVTATIKGSFIQVRRSAYASGPMMPVLDQNSAHLTKFGPALTTGLRPYRSLVDSGQVPFYRPPGRRNYGYDVGLLPQDLDLFAVRNSSPESQDPNRYFREVSRDDPWVHTLLCGRTDNGHFLPDGLRPDQCPLNARDFFRTQT